MQPEIIENPQVNKNYVPVVIDLTADTKATAPVIVFDKQIYLAAIDNMPLEEITAGWIKSIKDAAIAIDKRLNVPIQAWRAEIDEIITHANNRIAALKAEAAKKEAERREEKRLEVQNLIADAKRSSDLPKEYLDRITFKEEYLQVGFKGKKLADDIQAQFDTQKALKKGADDALELKATQVKARRLLIEKLNQEFGFNFSYDDFIVERYSDEQVNQFYMDKHNAKQNQEEKTISNAAIPREAEAIKVLEQNKQSQEKCSTPQEVQQSTNFVVPGQTNNGTQSPYRIVKITGKRLEAIDANLEALRKMGFGVEIVE